MLNSSVPQYSIYTRYLLGKINKRVYCVRGNVCSREKDASYRVYMFLISINSRIDVAMCNCTSVRPSIRPCDRLDLRD